MPFMNDLGVGSKEQNLVLGRILPVTGLCGWGDIKATGIQARAARLTLKLYFPLRNRDNPSAWLCFEEHGSYEYLSLL